jgi:hypothetical protein
MSSSHEPWIDRWWPVFLIAFGVACFMGIDFFHPNF